MDITLVNPEQIVMHSQFIAAVASLLCGGFAAYLTLSYHKLYPVSSKMLLVAVMIMSAVFLEIIRHASLLEPFTAVQLTGRAVHMTLTSCFSALAFGLVLVLLVTNHSRLVTSIRHTFMETTSIIKTSKISELTRTQRMRIIESSNFDDILTTLNLITSPGTDRLLKAINVAGWGLILANICFIVVIEVTNHL